MMSLGVRLCQVPARRLIQADHARTRDDTNSWSRPPPPSTAFQPVLPVTVYAFISNTPQTPALSNKFHYSRRERVIGCTRILSGTFFYSFLALVGFDRFAQLSCVSRVCFCSDFLVTLNVYLLVSFFNKLWNGCCYCVIYTDTSCVLTEVADLPARGQAKQNKMILLPFSPLLKNSEDNRINPYPPAIYLHAATKTGDTWKIHLKKANFHFYLVLLPF